MRKIGRRAAEAVEERGLTKGNTAKRNTPRTQRRIRVQSELDRVREVARSALRDLTDPLCGVGHQAEVEGAAGARFRVNT